MGGWVLLHYLHQGLSEHERLHTQLVIVMFFGQDTEGITCKNTPTTIA